MACVLMFHWIGCVAVHGAPINYRCDFNVASDRKEHAQTSPRPLAVEYVYDPAKGGGVIVGEDSDLLVVSGREAISFVARHTDGSVVSTTILNKPDPGNRFAAVLSAHKIESALKPEQWLGSCTVLQRG